MRALFPRRPRGRHRANILPPVVPSLRLSPVVLCQHGLTRCDCMPNPETTVWIRPVREVHRG